MASHVTSTPSLGRSRSRRGVAAALVAALAIGPLGITACSGSSDSAAADAAAAGATIIDVRTPAEFADGHLEGAVNIDVQSPDFDARIASLDPSGTYLVYCRSGNRSAVAVDRMEALGFADLSDLGSVAAASGATGVPVVR
jgi:phage shock protein E